MALKDLVARLEEDAAAEVRAIVERADAEVRTIRAAAETAVRRVSTQRLDCQRSARALDRARELAIARRQARAEELEARHALLARVLERARALVPETGASRPYLDALPSHVEQALSYVEGLCPRVRCRAGAASDIAAIVARHDGAAIVVDETIGPGVIVEAANGSVVVDNTLAARLARVERTLSVDLAAELSHVVA